MEAKRRGRTPKQASDVATRIGGMPRFSIELPEKLLADIDRMAEANDRSRNAEIRVLLAESVLARGKQ